LKIIETPVFPVEGNQLLMRPLFHNPAFRKDNDPVGISYG